MRTEVVVIGAGQAGLSAAYHLARTGLTDFVVLDDADYPGGAWQHRWPTLTVGQAHDLNSLPGMPLSETDPTEPVSVAIARYFAAYEHEVGLRVERPVRVRAVRDATPEEADGETDLLAVETDRGTWLTRGLVNATGTWQKPSGPRTRGSGRSPASRCTAGTTGRPRTSPGSTWSSSGAAPLPYSCSWRSRASPRPRG